MTLRTLNHKHFLPHEHRRRISNLGVAYSQLWCDIPVSSTTSPCDRAERRSGLKNGKRLPWLSGSIFFFSLQQPSNYFVKDRFMRSTVPPKFLILCLGADPWNMKQSSSHIHIPPHFTTISLNMHSQFLSNNFFIYTLLYLFATDGRSWIFRMRRYTHWSCSVAWVKGFPQSLHCFDAPWSDPLFVLHGLCKRFRW